MVLAQRDISIRQEFISTLIVLLFITTVSQTVKRTEWEDWLLFQPLLQFPFWKPLLSFTSDLMLMPDTFLFLTGRSPHMWQWTAGFVIRTQWCHMGIATAGIAPTVSSTTVSKRMETTTSPSPLSTWNTSTMLFQVLQLSVIPPNHSSGWAAKFCFARNATTIKLQRSNSLLHSHQGRRANMMRRLRCISTIWSRPTNCVVHARLLWNIT